MKKRPKDEVSENASDTMRQFFEEQYAKSRLAKQKKSKAPDERSIWEIMQFELKTEEFEKRVFH